MLGRLHSIQLVHASSNESDGAVSYITNVNENLIEKCIEEMYEANMIQISRHIRVKYFHRHLLSQSIVMDIKVDDSTKNNLIVFHKIKHCAMEIRTDEWSTDSHHHHNDGIKTSQTKDDGADTEESNDSSSSDDEISDDNEENGEENEERQNATVSENETLTSIRITCNYEDIRQRFRVRLRPGVLARVVEENALSIVDEIPLRYFKSNPESYFMNVLKTRFEVENGSMKKEFFRDENVEDNEFLEDATFEDFEHFNSSLADEKPSMEGIINGLCPIRDDSNVIDGPHRQIQSRVRRLFESITLRDCNLMQTLIRKFFNPRKYGAQNLNSTRDKYGQTLLHCCVRYDAKRCMMKLLNNFDMDSEIVDRDGRTALHMASKDGRTEMIRILLVKGANVHARAPGDYTSLHFAAENGYLEIVKLLLENGARVYHHTSKGTLPSDLTSNISVKALLTQKEKELLREVNMAAGSNSDGHGIVYGKIRGKTIRH